jgi:SAM-dependent methyltransferase
MSTDQIEMLRADWKAVLLPPLYQLVPNIHEVYELHLAYLESRLLAEAEIIENGAFFASVDGHPTRHFLMCTGQPLRLPDHSSCRLKAFFERNLFRTGYGTHGLFPYRGKFHPQMVKALMNIMGLKAGQTVLDPMMGSGTVCVEASLMGINSIGVDISPFCEFMARTKLTALTMDLTRVHGARKNLEKVIEYFTKRVGSQSWDDRRQSGARHPITTQSLRTDEVLSLHPKGDRDTLDTQNLLLLAYLDSVGYAQRTRGKDLVKLFCGILDRYLFVCEKIQRTLVSDYTWLGKATTLTGDARALPLAEGSVDGVLFSPPYSFAVDYIANDSFHLQALGVDVADLREMMVGLRGGPRLRDKYDTYRQDMRKILEECGRVLKHGRLCTIVIGTNSSQISRALHIPEDQVQGLDEFIRQLAPDSGLAFVQQIDRPVLGLMNTMREEHIVVLQKE